MRPSTIGEHELHAFLDGELAPARRDEVEAFLSTHPEVAARLEEYRRQGGALHALFDPMLGEAVPARHQAAVRPRRTGASTRRAAAVAALLIGGCAGWFGNEISRRPAPLVAQAPFARQAAVAHAVYVPEVRHPVEVPADQEEHLAGWLSRRLGARLRVPQLQPVGYRLMGGRLLPGSSGPAAQFMYENVAGERLTLYVSPAPRRGESAFRYAHENGVGVFHWVDRDLAYALAGASEREALLKAAHLIYRQLER